MRSRPLARGVPVMLAVLAACAHRAAPAAPAPDPATLRAVDSLFAPYDLADGPGASLLVMRDGRVLLERSWGLAVVETRTPATAHTSYRLASLTKQFTATAILLLVRDGRLRLDEPARAVLPELPAYASAVTIRQLLTHTSGLWDYEDFVPDTARTQVHDADVPALLHRVDSTYFPPGTQWRYSNTGYALLALVVERASGERFARFLHDRIFVPAGMDSTVAYEAGISTIPERAYGYSADSAGGFRRTDQSPTSAVLGDGGIYTSVHDLAAWSRALDRAAIVGRALRDSSWTPARLAGGALTDYGFGWFVDRDADGVRLSHHGETRGFTNAILRIPARGLTVVVLTNRTGGAPWDLAARVAALPAYAAPASGR